jgi:hypothetical protein
MADEKKSNIFKKALEAGEALLDVQIAKARSSAIMQIPEQGDFDFGTAVTKDRYQIVNSQGYQDKIGSVGYEFLKMMAFRSSVVSGIVRTRQNLVASYALLCREGIDRGWRISIRDEGEKIAALVEAKMGKDGEKKGLDERQLKIEAKKELEIKAKAKRRYVEDFIANCGEKEHKPFEAKRWNFDRYLRALVYDSLVYDQMVTEFIEKEAAIKGASTLSYIRPIDASTIRFASYQLSSSINSTAIGDYNILYPEEELRQLEEEGGKLELDQKLLDEGAYKYVQLIRGKVERAFTEEQLALGVRNPITDIAFNGYGLSELEVILSLVTSHMQTEHFNILFFRQGFSAKGILHIKANLNRSKLEEIRTHWKHLISGNRNTFQTPIFSGADDIQWIPLTQNHSEMEFSLWMNYLIKMICSTYQIDPLEIGFGIQDAGGSSGGMGRDNSAEKLENSRDKGFIPLMRFMENYINDNIISRLDPEFKFEWVGLVEDDPVQQVQQEAQEVIYKKTVNEIRAESGLEPLELGDMILSPVYFQAWSQFSEEARNLKMEDQQAQMEMQSQFAPPEQEADEGQFEENPDEQFAREEESKQNDHERDLELKDKDHENKLEQIKTEAKARPALKKSIKPIKIEYYKINE